MFSGDADRKRRGTAERATEIATDEMKVGAMARTMLRRLLESGAASHEEIDALQSLEGSRAAFSLNFPL